MSCGNDWARHLDAAKTLCEAVDEFCHFIEELPNTALVEKAWGPKEVLAHLVFWHESFVTQIEALLAQESIEIPEGRFRDLNEQVVKASYSASVDELVCRFRAANERLCGFAQNHHLKNITLKIKKGSKSRALSSLMAEEVGHIRTHYQLLARQAEYDPLDIVEKLCKTVDEICRFIQELLVEDIELARGAKRVLAYLTLRHESYVAQIEATLAEEPFKVPLDEDLNAHAVDVIQGVSTDELLRRFQRADEQLCGFAQALDPQRIVLEMKKGSDLHTLDSFLSKINDNIRRRHRELEQEVKELKTW